MPQPKQYRRDIYAIKEWDSAIGAYCFTKMTKDPARAKRLKQDAVSVLRMTGRPELVKIVHPAQWVVDNFLAVGNTIQ